MPNLQVVVDSTNASPDELQACLATLGRDVTVLHPDTRGTPSLQPRGGVLLTTAKAGFSHGAVRRLAKRAERPGRVVTRVYAPGLGSNAVAVWSAEWLNERGLGAADLPAMGIRFDRENLPHDSPHVRHWVRSDEIGIALLSNVTRWPRAWSWFKGGQIYAKTVYAAARSKAGVVKRRRQLRTQRLQRG